MKYTDVVKEVILRRRITDPMLSFWGKQIEKESGEK